MFYRRMSGFTTNGIPHGKELETLPCSELLVSQMSDEINALHNSVNGSRLGLDPEAGVALGSDRPEAIKVVNKRNPQRQEKITIGTWNVRSMYQAGKLDNVIQEMDRMRIDALGISEVRWTDSGSILKDSGHRLFYSGGENHQNGVGILVNKRMAAAVLTYLPMSDRIIMVKIQGKPFNINLVQVYMPTSTHDDEEVEIVYEQIQELMAGMKNDEINIILGDMNAKVGQGRDGIEVGPHGLGTRNERGDRLIEFCHQNQLCVTNTWFKHHARHLYTWSAPQNEETSREIRNQIDYILIKQRFRNSVVNVKTFPGADCNSDHNPVVMKMRTRLKRLEKPKTKLRLDIEKLNSSVTHQQQFAVEVSNRFQALSESTEDGIQEDERESVNDRWNNVKKALTESAEAVLGKSEKRKRAAWMTEEILQKMEERRKVKNDKSRYKEIHVDIQKKCREAKETWINKQCQEVEELEKRHAHKAVHKKVKEVTNYKKNSKSSGTIRDKDGKLCYEKESIQRRWKEYIGELFEDETRPSTPHLDIEGKEDEPPFLMQEMEAALKEMNTGKATGEDGIAIEMIQSLGNDSKVLVLSLLNKIYSTGQLPQDFTRSVFVAIPKKARATECKDHRTISLMPHVLKLLLKMVIKRIKTAIEPEVAEQQFGFQQGKGTRESIFALRTICERAIEVQRDIYICFIDYEKAFDKVMHEKLIDILKAQNIGKNNLQLIRNLYWLQEAAIRVEGEITEWTEIKRGVRQGCILSPLLFILYTEMIMRESEISDLGIVVGGKNITDFRFADDTALTAWTEAHLQVMLNKVVKISDKYGLKINIKKTKVMKVSKMYDDMTKNNRPTNQQNTNININGEKLEEVTCYQYLGSLVTSDGRCNTEIKSRIGKAKTQFGKLKTLLCNTKINMNVRKRMLQCYVWPVLLYGAEAWTLKEDMKRRLRAFEMWCYRRMMKISWISKISNNRVLDMARTQRILMTNIMRRKARYCGHMTRHSDFLNLLLEGKIEGTRARGRQRRTWLDDLCDWTKIKNKCTLLNCCKDKQRWKTLASNLHDGEGT